MTQINSLETIASSESAIWLTLNGLDYKCNVSSLGLPRRGELIAAGLTGNALANSGPWDVFTADFNPHGWWDASSVACLWVRDNKFPRVRWDWNVRFNFTGGSCKISVTVNDVPVPGCEWMNMDAAAGVSFQGRVHFSSPPFSVSSGDKVAVYNISGGSRNTQGAPERRYSLVSA